MAKRRGHRAYTRRDPRSGRRVQVAAAGVQTARGRVKGARTLRKRAVAARGPDALSRAEARLGVTRNQGGFRDRRSAAHAVLNAPARLAAQRRLRSRQLVARQRQLVTAQRRYATAKANARATARKAATSRHKKRSSAQRAATATRRGNRMIRRLLG
jgi:hypothetical protein